MPTRLRLGPITLHWGSKDGGPDSHVYMYGIECKAVCSALVLRFEDGSRDAFHSHAFNAISWVLRGELQEELLPNEHTLRKWGCGWKSLYRASLTAIFTARECCHMVTSFGRTWVLSLRGPWAPTWVDIDGATGAATTLTHGRVRAAGGRRIP